MQAFPNHRLQANLTTRGRVTAILDMILGLCPRATTHSQWSRSLAPENALLAHPRCPQVSIL
jgi:hypothetical protein